MKKFIKPLIYSVVTMFILTFIITLFNYINVISGVPFKIIKILILVFSYLIAGFMIGKVSDKKGWLNGIEIGLILTIFYLIINIIFKTKVNIILILYYIGLTLLSTFGSILGINKKAA